MSFLIPSLLTANRYARAHAILAVGLVCALASLLPSATAIAQVDRGNDATAAEMSVSDLLAIGTQTPVAAASSTVLRTNHSVAMHLQTRGLVPGHVYTVWWVVFDRPQFCDGTPCAEADIGTQAVQVSVLWATGAIADSEGFARFAAHLIPGRPEGQVVLGSGSFNPKRAEIHLVVRDHGPGGSLGATILEQLTTFGAGCPGGACIDVQAAIHLR